MAKLAPLLAFLISSNLSSAPACADEVVRFANLGPDASNLYQYLGLEKNIYLSNGVNLQLNEFLAGGPSVVPAAVSGQIDMGGIGTPVLTAISRGMPIKVVGAPPLKGQEFVLVAKNNIRKFRDLLGQTVGIGSVGGGQDQALRVMLTKEQIDRHQISVIAVGNQSNGYLAFESGKLAAVIVTEPLVSKIQLEGTGHVLAKAVDYFGRYEHNYIFSSNRFIQDHPDALRSYFLANSKALEFAASHEDELVSFGTKKLGLDSTLLKKVFDASLPSWDDSQQIDVQGTLGAIKILQTTGDIDPDYRPVIDAIVDRRFIPLESR